MEKSATEIVGELDSDDLLYRINRFMKSAIRSSVRSQSDFEEAYRELIVNRLIEANFKNEYSSKFDGVSDNVRSKTKFLFESLIRFVNDQSDPVRKGALFLLLCYIKPESPQFVSQASSLREHIDPTYSPVPADFVEYIDSMLHGTGVNVPQLSPIEHFRNMSVMSIAGEQMQCRIAYANRNEIKKVYCGCSSADSLLFDKVGNEFDIYITLPGLSIRHLTSEFLAEIYRSIISKRISKVGSQVEIVVCVGFVDRLKIIGSLDVWEKSPLQSHIEQLVANALEGIKNVNAVGRGLFKFKLYPGCFPARNVKKVTVNGVAPFHRSNAVVCDVVEDVLSGICSGAGEKYYFPRSAVIAKTALIHDREIHPKLGVDLSRIAQDA